MDWHVIKENEWGAEVWRYSGNVIKKADDRVLLDARFNRDDFIFHGIPFCKGDRFIEAYFSKQWFNIFEIYQGESDSLKGWYCNVTFPAVIRAEEIHYRDLALDVLIYADHHYLLLDEEEFAALEIRPEIKEKARKIPQELLSLFKHYQYQSIVNWFDAV